MGGGSSSAPAAYTPPPPDERMNRVILASNLAAAKNLYNLGQSTVPLQQGIAQAQFGQGQQLANLVAGQQGEAANRMLGYATSQPLETWTPDIFGNQGAMTQAAQVAALNQFKSKELEKQQNAPAAQAREQLMQTAANVSSPDYWKNQMNEWAKTKGLQSYLGTGLQDSTIGKSGYFDLATPQGQAFQAQNAGLAQGIIGQQQQIGLDPTAAVGSLQNAQAQAMQDRAGYRAGILGAMEQNAQTNLANQGNAANAYQVGTGQYAKSTSDWINQLMGGYGQNLQQQTSALGAFENKRSSDIQNYQQALMNASAQNAASANASQGSMMGSTMGLVGSGLMAAGMAY
jgi:hypothetical protein